MVAYVAVLRRDGTPPERVIRLVKDAVTASALPVGASRSRATDVVVRWAIEVHYAA